MKDLLISKLIDILKRKDIKDEIKKIISPLTEIIITEIYPYFYIIIFFVFLIFVIILANFVILISIIRVNYKMFYKND